jgi:predicted Rossmann fold nucleotide-binding protein DprA/Smf involved in DNA uptake
MKQFRIEAIVDERALWNVMALLEGAKARGILARPHHEPKESQSEPGAVITRARGKGAGKGSAIMVNGVPAHTVATDAIIAAVGAREIVTAKEIIASTGLKKESVYRALHELKKQHIVKHVGIGQYSKGRKEAP